MTKEDRNLLLIDLCARIPYGVKVSIDNTTWCDFDGRTPSEITFDNSYRLLFLGTKLGYVKPYLLPLSSMNEEQQKEYNTFSLGPDWVSNPYYNVPAFEVLDWLNAHHFDYRGLINKGLAIDATNLNVY